MQLVVMVGECGMERNMKRNMERDMEQQSMQMLHDNFGQIACMVQGQKMTNYGSDIFAHHLKGSF